MTLIESNLNKDERELAMSSYDLHAIEAHVAIMNLEGEYSRRWDTLDLSGWVALFTGDGVFETIGVGKLPTLRYQGATELNKFCVETTKRFEGLHLLHTPSITVEGEAAKSWIHFEFVSNRVHPVTSELNKSEGIYCTEYRKTARGWRIQHRIERVVSINGRQFHGVPATLEPSGG